MPLKAMDEATYMTNGKKKTLKHASECAADACAKLNRDERPFSLRTARNVKNLAAQKSYSAECALDHTSEENQPLVRDIP